MADADRSKFASTLIAIAAATGLLVIGRMTGDNWVSVTTWSLAVYVLGQPVAVLADGYVKAKAAEVKGK